MLCYRDCPIAVFVSAQAPWADFSCTFRLTCGGWLCTAQSGPFVLSGRPWILPCAAVVQGQLESGQSIKQNLGSPCLAVFFLVSVAALVSLSSGSHEQKAGGLIFNWNFSWTALKSKLQKWGIHALPVLIKVFWDRGDTHLREFCCCVK